MKKFFIVVGIGYNEDGYSSSYLKILFFHIYMSFQNYNGNNLSKLNEIENICNKNNFTNIKELYNNKDNNNEIDNLFEYFVKYIIYNKYLIESLYHNFTEIFNYLLAFETIKFSSYYLRNFYLYDFNNNKFLLSWDDINKNILSLKNTIYLNKSSKIFSEIIYQSTTLFSNYIYENKLYYKQNKYNFIKLELTSTFPRIILLIKYLPILKGTVIIYLYTEYKLSRLRNNNSIRDSNINITRYKEFDILNGEYYKNNFNNMDYRFIDNIYLLYVEKFLIEFLIGNNNKFDNFFDEGKRLKYYNYDVLKDMINFMFDDEEKEKNLEEKLKNLDLFLKNKYLSENRIKKKFTIEKKTTIYTNEKKNTKFEDIENLINIQLVDALYVLVDKKNILNVENNNNHNNKDKSILNSVNKSSILDTSNNKNKSFSIDNFEKDEFSLNNKSYTISNFQIPNEISIVQKIEKNKENLIDMNNLGFNEIESELNKTNIIYKNELNTNRGYYSNENLISEEQNLLVNIKSKQEKKEKGKLILLEDINNKN